MKAPFYKKDANGKRYDVNGNPDYESPKKHLDIYDEDINEMLEACIDQYAQNGFYLSLKDWYLSRGRLSDKQMDCLKRGYSAIKRFV